MGSFYDLDYMIEMNEERLEQYSNAYQRTIDKFTNILVLYSAFAIFLIPIIQSLYFSVAKCYWLYYASFYVFIILFTVSLINTIRLLAPVKAAHLMEPRIYYQNYRSDYDNGNRGQDEVDALIKGSYICELENAIKVNNKIFERKDLFYYSAFTFAILSTIPYLLCIIFLLSMKDDSMHKTAIINNFSTFNKTQYMAKDSNKKNQGNTTEILISNLPGIDNSQVIPSLPQYRTIGVQVNLLWDNEIVKFLKDSFKKLFRHH